MKELGCMAKDEEDELEDFENIIDKISSINDLPNDALFNAYNLLVKLFNNIIKNPKDEKFRIIKSSNKIIKSQLFFDDRIGILFTKLIMSAGFTRTEQGFVFPLDRNVDELWNIVNMLDAILHSYKHSDKPKQDVLTSVNRNKSEDFSLSSSSLETSAKKKDYSQTFRRRDENDIIQRANAELNAVREKQREKYKEKKNVSSSSSNQNSSGNNDQSGGSGFFDFLWGGSGGGGGGTGRGGGGGRGGRGTARERESNRRRFMTLRDIAPTNRSS